MTLTPLRQAIYSHLVSNTGVTALVGNRIYYQQAPSGSVLPYVIFKPAQVDYPAEAGYRMTEQKWELWAVGEEAGQVDTVTAALDTALHDSNLTISGWNTVLVEVQSETIAEVINIASQQWYKRGLIVRILADNA